MDFNAANICAAIFNSRRHKESDKVFSLSDFVLSFFNGGGKQDERTGDQELLAFKAAVGAGRRKR